MHQPRAREPDWSPRQIGCEATLRDFSLYLLQLHVDVEAAHPCHTSGSFISDYNWRGKERQNKGLVSAAPPDLRSISPPDCTYLCVCGGRGRPSEFTVASLKPSSLPDMPKPETVSVILLSFPPNIPVFYSSYPPPFVSPPFSSPHPYLCVSSTPWPWPSACSFTHPHVRKSLLPVSAGKLFCPPIPCFHYLV